MAHSVKKEGQTLFQSSQSKTAVFNPGSSCTFQHIMRNALCAIFPQSSISDFRIFSRGIVPPYRTTPGPSSEFKSGCAPTFESFLENPAHYADRDQSTTQTASLIAASFRI